MKDIILKVSNIGKAYRNYGSEWRRVLSWFGLNYKPVQETWTLKNINFSIESGEAIGIIGQNGAGKSTLLKIITGTLKPTTGKVTVRGKIAAILELGMGFHPDLTGRQNAYHSAGLMGYTGEQIDSVMDQIELFAEIGEYFDQPVRLYSSGMQMRVAFSVATAFRPEILIIDEALSVGDAYFQHKSFDRIRQYRDQGTSLLFVSHDKSSILALCDRVVLLEKGNLLKDGEPEEITDYYNALIAEKENATIRQEKKEDGKTITVSGNKDAEFIDTVILDANKLPIEVVNVGQSISIQFTVKINKDLPSLVLGCGIKDKFGQMMFGTNTYYTKQQIKNLQKNEVYTFTVNFFANLGIGSYSVHSSLVANKSHVESNYHWIDGIKTFEVVNLDKIEFVGCMWNEMKFNIHKEEENDSNV